jgi:hypothetical protein
MAYDLNVTGTSRMAELAEELGANLSISPQILYLTDNREIIVKQTFLNPAIIMEKPSSWERKRSKKPCPITLLFACR